MKVVYPVLASVYCDRCKGHTMHEHGIRYDIPFSVCQICNNKRDTTLSELNMIAFGLLGYIDIALLKSYDVTRRVEEDAR